MSKAIRHRSLVELGGARTLVVVPMLKDDELIGAIAIYRQEVRPFTDKQIELVQNFAAQAVIAIENTRLLNELRQRTDDLSELLEQQTATAEVLKVISSSPGELEPVFDACWKTPRASASAKFGSLLLREGERSACAARRRRTPSVCSESCSAAAIRLLDRRTGCTASVDASERRSSRVADTRQIRLHRRQRSRLRATARSRSSPCRCCKETS